MRAWEAPEALAIPYVNGRPHVGHAVELVKTDVLTELIATCRVAASGSSPGLVTLHSRKASR